MVYNRGDTSPWSLKCKLINSFSCCCKMLTSSGVKNSVFNSSISDKQTKVWGRLWNPVAFLASD